MLPRSGDVLYLTREASVQFIEPILFRVIRCHDWQTYDGWVWLDGYQLDNVGDMAVERRSIFVQMAGLRQVPKPSTQAAPAARDPRARNAGPQPTAPGHSTGAVRRGHTTGPQRGFRR